MFRIGMHWILGRVGVYDNAASRFVVDFAFEPNSNMHTHLKATLRTEQRFKPCAVTHAQDGSDAIH